MGAVGQLAIVSGSYLLFTVTDGAIRMIVLQHAFSNGFSAIQVPSALPHGARALSAHAPSCARPPARPHPEQVAVMFTLYELAGVVTNLGAGLMGARWGIKSTLLSGLSLQLVAYALLFGWNDEWTQAESIVYVTVAQMFGARIAHRTPPSLAPSNRALPPTQAASPRTSPSLAGRR